MIIKKGSEIPQSSPQHGECLDATVPGTPGRFYFGKDRNGTRTHQVHVCADGHPEIADKLAFRDYVRAHPVEAAAYGELKQRLALAHSDDNIGYMLGKGRLCEIAFGGAATLVRVE